MTKINKRTLSMITFFAVIGTSSLVYIQYDFLNGDVNEVTALYGWVQLAVALCAAVAVKVRQNHAPAIYVSFAALLLMQIVPAFFWFWFNGQIVNDKPYGGVMGHWLFGAYHLFMILWGFFNAYKFLKEREPMNGHTESTGERI